MAFDSPIDDAPPGEVAPYRKGWKHRLNALRKRSPLNPYWIELRKLWRSVEFLAPFVHGKVLDVGCGERPYDELLVPQATQYVGMEYPPATFNLIPDLWGMLDRLQGVINVFGDGTKLPFADQSFDTVVAFEVLEHLPDPEPCLSEMNRVLKPGGAILITVPMIAPLHQMPFDYARFTPGGLEVMFKRHGFEIHALRPRGNFASVMGSTTAHWLIRTFGRTHLLRDGSAKLSRWRAPLISPLVAAAQVMALMSEPWADEMATLGYGVVAMRSGEIKRDSSSSNGSNTTSQS